MLKLGEFAAIQLETIITIKTYKNNQKILYTNYVKCKKF